jgi:hypothetical protein
VIRLGDVWLGKGFSSIWSGLVRSGGVWWGGVRCGWARLSNLIVADNHCQVLYVTRHGAVE